MLQDFAEAHYVADMGAQVVPKAPNKLGANQTDVDAGIWAAGRVLRTRSTLWTIWNRSRQIK